MSDLTEHKLICCHLPFFPPCVPVARRSGNLCLYFFLSLFSTRYVKCGHKNNQQRSARRWTCNVVKHGTFLSSFTLTLSLFSSLSFYFFIYYSTSFLFFTFLHLLRSFLVLSPKRICNSLLQIEYK